MEKNTKERRSQGEQWVYEAVNASGWARLDPEQCPIARTETGKPYFPSCPQICFSVSHSGPYWACVVTDRPVGLDLQKHKGGRLEDIARRFFHPQEADWLETQPRECFFDVWAAKESYVKWTGQGIDRHFGQVSVVENGELAKQAGGGYFYRMRWQDYSLCLCGEEPWQQVELIVMDEGGQA